MNEQTHTQTKPRAAAAEKSAPKIRWSNVEGDTKRLRDYLERTQLPPDPEGMNDKRAAWGERAIVEFQKATGTDREDALSDLLADLFHWCDRNGTNFEHELERARGHYDEETLDDETTQPAHEGEVPPCKVCGGILSHKDGCKFTGRRVEVQS